MTDSEVAAEEISAVVFRRAFANGALPAGETIDRMLLAELRELMPIGNLRLEIQSSSEPVTIRGNVKRIDLERAVVQLPATERLVFLMHDVESYDHARIAQILGITEQESQMGLHQARLRLRELLGSSL
jgi:DNA-directed RNA polymerase specialized sigma24 family protein